MNTMLRSSNAPQQTALAPSSMSPTGHATGSGVPRGVWIGGGLMALTIVALATALVMKSGGTGAETTASLPPAPATTLSTPAPVATTPAPVTPAPAPVADNTAPVAPVHHTVHHTTPRTTTSSNGDTTSSTSTTTTTTTSSNGGLSGGTTAGTTGNTTVASVPVCTTCGVVDSYSAVQVQGQNNGVGAVAGGVGGAVLGSAVAGRHNRTLGGVIGAIGGGLLGNTIETHERTTTMYDVHVRMNDGSMRTVRQSTIPQVGERVTVDGNAIHAAPAQTSSSNYGGGTNYAPAANNGSTFSPTGS